MTHRHIGLRFLLLLLLGMPAGARAGVRAGDVPDLRFQSLDDVPIDVQDYRGRVVVIDFFASFCHVCDAEAAKKKALAEKYADAVTFIGVAADEAREPVDEFVKAKALTWPVTNDQQIVQALNFEQYSTAAILNPDGKVAWVGLSFELEKQLQGVLRRTPPVKVSPKVLQQTMATTQQAQKLMDEGNLREASRRLDAIPAPARRIGSVGKSLKALADAREKLALSVLEKAKADVLAEKFLPAIRAYQAIQTAVPKSEPARASATALAALRQNPNAASAFAQAEKESQADEALHAATKLLEYGRKPQAVTKLQDVLRQFGGTEAAVQAQATLNTLQSPATQPAL